MSNTVSAPATGWSRSSGKAESNRATGSTLPRRRRREEADHGRRQEPRSMCNSNPASRRIPHCGTAGGFLPRVVCGVVADVTVGVNLVFVFTSAFSLQPSAFEMSGCNCANCSARVQASPLVNSRFPVAPSAASAKKAHPAIMASLVSVTRASAHGAGGAANAGWALAPVSNRCES